MKRKPPASERIKELESLLANETYAVAELESLLADVGAKKRNYAGVDEWYWPLAVIQAKEVGDLLFRVGAEKRGNEWYWPFYRPDDEPLMLPTAEWIEARKAAAQALSKAGEGDYDSTSSNVLPDPGTQALTD